MNYQVHYARLIERARGRTLDGYRERHHVVPRCMGGTNTPSNVVEVTPEEHYVAHQLLVKMHPRATGLAVAAVLIAKRATRNKAYGWLRRKHAEVMSERMRGKEHSPQTVAKLSAAKMGRKHPRTPEWTEKIAAANRGKRHTHETRSRMSEAQRGNTHNLGKTFSPEHRANLSAALIGHKSNPGVSKTPEHRAKIAAALTGRPLSAERRAKISAGRQMYFLNLRRA